MHPCILRIEGFANFTQNLGNMDYQEFFIELGRLLYAIAMTDGQVQKPEQEKVRQIVQEQLTTMADSSDAFGTPDAYYLEFEFERLHDFDTRIRDAFDSFIQYSKQNQALFTSEVKKLVMVSCEKVANAFNGIEDNEKVLLDKLRRHLDSL
jgi:hypothetical protein